MLYQSRFINYKKKKLTILVNDVDNGGGNAWRRGQKIYGNSMYHRLNFVLNLKLLLKNVLRILIRLRVPHVFLLKS